MKRILLCPPIHYDIEYEINPWMHVENKVDRSFAMREYLALKTAYTELPVELHEIEHVRGLPDMIYTANFGQVCNDTFICSNFKHPERQGEEEVACEWFSKNFGAQIYRLPKGIFFEGQGDLLQNDNNYFMGWGKRSSKEAINYLSEVLDKPIVDLELVDPFYYHLDMSFTPLSNDTVVIKPESFTSEGIKKIYELFSDVIIPMEEDQKIMACNMVCVGDKIIIAKGISDHLKNEFARRGLTAIEIPMEEYRKGGGSIKCSSFEF